jgi:acyl carrier protein
MAEVTGSAAPVSGEVGKRVRRVIQSHLGLAGPAPDDEARFDSDLDCDSLDCIEIVMQLEEEFDIPISDDDATRLETVGDAVRLVERLTAGTPPPSSFEGAVA